MFGRIECVCHSLGKNRVDVGVAVDRDWLAVDDSDLRTGQWNEVVIPTGVAERRSSGGGDHDQGPTGQSSEPKRAGPQDVGRSARAVQGDPHGVTFFQGPSHLLESGRRIAVTIPRERHRLHAIAFKPAPHGRAGHTRRDKRVIRMWFPLGVNCQGEHGQPVPRHGDRAHWWRFAFKGDEG